MRNQRGQQLVEFTLVLLIFLVLIWVPVDFGLAFYTGQIASNASREGARIAAATVTLPASPSSCTMPCARTRGSGWGPAGGWPRRR